MPTNVRRRPAPLVYFLGFVMVLFIGILIFVYVVTKRTSPVVLDERGRPVASGHDHAGH